MGFMHTMTCFTDGIQSTEPVRWRSLDGMVGVFWRARAVEMARGYYLSPDPRLMIFFNDVSDQIQISNRDNGQAWRPMTRAVYVPAGMPMWTTFRQPHQFSHLDLHLLQDRMMRFLEPALGVSAALQAIRTPVEIENFQSVDALAQLLVQELSHPTKHAVYSESLISGIVTGLLDLPTDMTAKTTAKMTGEQNTEKAVASPLPDMNMTLAGGLTGAQMNRLRQHVRDSQDRRLSVAEMAEIAGLSESWFANAFKKSTGKTPHQWQLEQRIALVQHLLRDSDMKVADIAAQLGFSDQAHLTKAFRQVAGETPAAWRRMQRMG